MNILELNNVNFTYQSDERETKAVENISFSIQNGDFVGLVGPSGCGKTTILNMLAGIFSPSSGSITLHGEDITKLKGRIALMPQRDQLFEWRTIEKNIMLGLEIKKTKNNGREKEKKKKNKEEQQKPSENNDQNGKK